MPKALPAVPRSPSPSARACTFRLLLPWPVRVPLTRLSPSCVSVSVMVPPDEFLAV
jgi:hypothetical protein